MKKAVLELLETGNRYSGRQLAKCLGIDTPMIRRIINDLRCDGVPVCANRKGYYLTTDEDEIRKTVESLERRIKHIQGAVNGLKGGDAECHV